MERTIGVPQSVVYVVVVPLRIVNGMVEATEIPTVFGDVGHAAQRPVEGGIEDCALPFRSPHCADPTKRAVPNSFRACLNSVEGPAGNLPFKIAPCLVRTYIGDPDPHLDRLSRGRWRVSNKPDAIARLFRRVAQIAVLPCLVRAEGTGKFHIEVLPRFLV